MSSTWSAVDTGIRIVSWTLSGNETTIWNVVTHVAGWLA